MFATNSGTGKSFCVGLACEEAPGGEVGKKIFGESDSASEAHTPSSPDRSRLVPLALDYTRLSLPKPNRERVRRLAPKMYQDHVLWAWLSFFHP